VDSDWSKGLDHARALGAAYGLIIARTNPDVPKHKGITAFLVDMHAPGVEVLPLYQATGRSRIQRVLLQRGPYPRTRRRLGGVGEGWGVSITTLMNERGSIGGTVPPRSAGLIGRSPEDPGANIGRRVATRTRSRGAQ